MQLPDFDKRSGASCTKINIATFSSFAMFANLFAGIGEGETALNFRF